MRLTGTDLDEWARRRAAESELPELVRRLIHATSDRLVQLEMPADEGIAKHGFDGWVEARGGNEFVPSGASAWELGRGEDYAAKAQKDYRTRTDKPPVGVDLASTTFVFVTPRRWSKTEPSLSTWQRERKAEKKWKDVKILDADALISWLHQAPSVEVWFAELLGRPSPLRSLDRAWREWSRETIPPSSEGLVLAGREVQRQTLLAWLERPPGVLSVHASHADEAVAFCWAVLRHLSVSARERWLARALVVVGDDELGRLSLESRRPMLLIARGCRVGLARLAVEQGHHVVLAETGRPQNGGLVLGPLDPPRTEVELERMGYKGDAWRLVAGVRGGELPGPGVSMSALRRALGGVDDDLPAELAPLVLVGAWTETDADLQAVCEILGDGPERLRELQRRHSGELGSALVCTGRRWRWASRRDAWRQLEPRLGPGDFARFEQVIVDVFAGELDCSAELRRGLLEGLVLLAAASSEDLASDLPDRVVSRLLGTNSSVDDLVRLGDALRPLAEAAPEVFLKRVSRIVRNGGDASPPRELIWALELLAWVEQHLFTVTELLAAIAIGDASGGVGEQARRSLREIYLPWMPHTLASASVRLANLDALARQHPSFTVELLLDLLPSGLDTSMATQLPKVRDWGHAREEVTSGEMTDYYLHLWQRVLALAQADARHWLSVVARLDQLTINEELRAQAITALCELDSSQLDASQREMLRRQLRATVHHHRRFPDASWSVPESQLEQLEALHDALAPEDLRDELAWVFDGSPALLHPSSLDAAGEELFAAIRQAQQAAARRLDAALTPAELVAFADRVGDAWALGFALGSLDDTEQPSLTLLRASLEEGHEGSGDLRKGLGAALFQRCGYELWNNEALATIPVPAQAELLLGYPSGSDTWDVAESRGPAFVEAYWLRARALYSSEHLERVIRSLLSVGRVSEALELAAFAQRGPDHALDSTLVVEMLETTIDLDMPEGSGHLSSHYVHSLLEQLRAQRDRWREQLRRFEWALLPRLDLFRGHKPLTLYRELGENPAYFVEIVQLAYPRHKLSEAERSDASLARELLFHWNAIPGLRDDSTVDVAGLRAWVQEARTRLQDAGLSELGDEQLGQVLARSPALPDGRWPVDEVCDVFEELDDSRNIEAGLVSRRGNRLSARVEVVDPERDRSRAAQLREQASSMRSRWPKMARVTEQLAERQEHNAAYWSELQRERDDWTPRATTKDRVESALDELEGTGRYVFDLDTLVEAAGDLPDLMRVLGELPRVAPISDDAYVIVRPEYRRIGAPPPSWYIDELMRRANTDYCVGLLSAAALHGAADQQPQIFQVLVAKPTEPTQIGQHTLEFVHRDRAQPFEVIRKNTVTGTMAVATPEATVFDLAEFCERYGGPDAVIAVLEELVEDLDIARVRATAEAYPPMVVARAADLLDGAGYPELASQLRKPSSTRALGA